MPAKKHDPTANATKSVYLGVSAAQSGRSGSDEPMTAVQNQSVTKEDEGATVRAERFMLWREQNAAAIADYNAMIQKLGIPLSEFRKF